MSHIINITYQKIETTTLRELLGFGNDKEMAEWLKVNKWRDDGSNTVFINNQEENIKTKNIQERIEFDAVAPVLALYR
jgi:translation initiation factor 3 subunit K